ncbi:hypothetical protein [Candidatus Amarolinea dominans]|uniref:hypothetical protein n=1 Tax=Candidatus Amarolinea dominans TaxID=3140696 RepID=UPI0031354B8B|nr:hypothetical protein [Anaerolineae bacterium]
MLHSIRRFAPLVLLVLSLISVPLAQANSAVNGAALLAEPLAAISFSGSYGPQTFDTLANSGSSSSLPPGWELSESGAQANTQYTAGYGSSGTGDTYSFGASGSSERALGTQRSGNFSSMFGVQFQNDTGEELTELSVQYVCEQWRRGGSGAADRLDFQVSTNATSLTTGTWINANALDCISPVTSGSAGAKDGNASANRTAVSGLIGGLSIANGATFWLRWTDFDVSAGNDGLTVDGFTLAPGALAAVLASFDAVQSGDAILVTWETVSEVGNVGFNLWRGTTPNAPDAQLNSGLIPSQAPGSSQGFSYEWLDAANLVNTTTYYYWLEDMDMAGAVTRHGPISATYAAPTAVHLLDISAAPASPIVLPLVAMGLAGLSALTLRRRR